MKSFIRFGEFLASLLVGIVCAVQPLTADESTLTDDSILGFIQTWKVITYVEEGHIDEPTNYDESVVFSAENLPDVGEFISGNEELTNQIEDTLPSSIESISDWVRIGNRLIAVYVQMGQPQLRDFLVSVSEQPQDNDAMLGISMRDAKTILEWMGAEPTTEERAGVDFYSEELSSMFGRN